MTGIQEIIKKEFAPGLSPEAFYEKFYPHISKIDETIEKKRKREIQKAMKYITYFIKRFLSNKTRVLNPFTDGLLYCYEYYVSSKPEGSGKLIQTWKVLKKIQEGT